MNEAGGPQEPAPDIEVAKPGELTVRTRSRTADAFYVFRNELETLRTTHSSLAAVYFGLSGGTAVTLLVTFLTTNLGDARPWFGAFAVAAVVLSLLLFFNMRREQHVSSELVKEIRVERKLE